MTTNNTKLDLTLSLENSPHLALIQAIAALTSASARLSFLLLCPSHSELNIAAEIILLKAVKSHHFSQQSLAA